MVLNCKISDEIENSEMKFRQKILLLKALKVFKHLRMKTEDIQGNCPPNAPVEKSLATEIWTNRSWINLISGMIHIK